MKHTYSLPSRREITLLLILIFVALTSFPSFSQTSNPNLPVIPPSPTAFNFGRYGFIKPGLHTGGVSLEIPISTYRTPNLSVPVSLKYISNGIKVEELSSRTGLVWNLNAGGAIVRMIKDEPDGYYSSATTSVMAEEVLKEISIDKTDPTFRAYLLGSANERYDSEYDIFSFNFMNFSGKFIITEKGEYIQENQSALRIENIAGSIDNGFRITDDMGIQYVFSEKETTQASSGPNNRTPVLPTSWYLSTIIHPKGDTIIFKYNRVITSFLFSGGDSYTKIFTPATPNAEFNAFISSNSGYREHLPSLNAIDGKRLSSIESNYGLRIDFYNKKDNPGQGGDSLLTNILIKSPTNQILDDIKLSYKITPNSRVFLDTVSFITPNKKFILSYYSPENVPVKNSKSQDHWGYFNGKNNTTLLPAHADLPNAYVPADREPDALYTQMGLLKDVTYPTGGKTSFIFEPNSFASSKAQQSTSAVSVKSETGSIDNGVETLSTILNSATDQNISILATLASATLEECPNSQDPDIIRRKGGKIRIYDLTAGRNIQIGDFLTDTVITFTNGLGTRTYNCQFLSGHQYKIILSTFSCSKLTVSTTYISQSVTVPYNEITGGMRLKEAKTVSEEGPETYFTYKYIENIDSEKSSGIVPFNSKMEYLSTRLKYFNSKIHGQNGDVIGATNFPYTETKVSSNSIDPLYDISGNQVVYSTVIEYQKGLNTDNGAILHHFKYEKNPTGQLIYGDGRYQPNTYSNFFWNNGLEDYTAYYKNEVNRYNLIKEEIFDYALIGSGAIQIIPMVRVQNSFIPPCQNDIISTSDATCSILSYTDLVSVDANNTNKRYRYSICKANHRHIWAPDAAGIKRCIATQSLNEDNYIPHLCFGKTPGTQIELKKTVALDAIMYNFYSYRYNLLSKKEVKYMNNNTITNTFKYTYNNNAHIKSITFINSRGEAIKDSTRYPVDLKGNIVYDSMVARNMAGYFIDQSTYNGTTELSKVSNKYDFRDGKLKILPVEIQRSNLSQAPFTEVIFKQYNKSGQVTEVQLLNGQTEVYIWGYNNLYPVARITGTDYNSAIQQVSQVMLDNAASYTDQQIRNELNKLRINLPNSLVRTFTYSPSVGLTSETDEAGKTVFYEYDNQGRLKTIKDQNGHILKHFSYQYRQPITQ